MHRRQIALALATLTAASAVPAAAQDQAGQQEQQQEGELDVAVLVPLTGFLALEGTSQRNGAVMALELPYDGPEIGYEVTDTNVTPEAAVTAMERAMDDDPVAIVAPMLGTQMLALLPLARDYELPLLTVSGTTEITQHGNPWIFRFFPDDSIVKVAHADYAVRVTGMQRPAVIYQTTAYGQSGRTQLVANLYELGVTPALEEGLPVDAREMLPVLTRAVEAGADGLILHLHAGPTALVIRQAKQMGLDLPIVAGSAMHQPATAELLEPEELAGVCAESGSAPNADTDPEVQSWVEAYRAAFDAEPDAFALGQFDAVRMLMAAIASGARTQEAVQNWMAANTFDGLAMTYKSDGNGNMAHDAVIICYDGTSRVPEIVERYHDVDGVLEEHRSR